MNSQKGCISAHLSRRELISRDTKISIRVENISAKTKFRQLEIACEEEVRNPSGGATEHRIMDFSDRAMWRSERLA